MKTFDENTIQSFVSVKDGIPHSPPATCPSKQAKWQSQKIHNIKTENLCISCEVELGYFIYLLSEIQTFY